MRILQTKRRMFQLNERKDFKPAISYLSMKKKVVLVFILLISIFLLAIVSAANETIDEKAFACLDKKVKNNCNKLTTEQQIFSLMALADDSSIQSECKSALTAKQKTDGSFDTNIKQTSLAVIAFDYVNQNTDKAVDWLLTKKKTPDLEWYLEIDSAVATSCTLNSGSGPKTITIAEDKKISGNPGTCFSLAYQNYWLRISNDCLNKNITVSCDKDFISTLLYKKPTTAGGEDIWYVSSDTKAGSSGAKTEHQISSYCFSTSTSCDYEASLWATLALSRTDESISQFTPYLIAYADDNNILFSSSFLYILTASEEYLSNIVNSQKDEGFWKLSSNEYYDTALGLLAVPNSEASTSAIAWMEEKQGNDGCWNSGNIRDTAFLLWAAFPKTPASTSGTTTEDDCESFNHYCMSRGECETVGNILNNFDCQGTSLQVCCDTPAPEKSCSDKNGEICSSGYDCSTLDVSASDTEKCCLGTCSPAISECQQYSFTCKSTCSENEQTDTLYACDSGKVCCKQKEDTGGGISLWIWILIILIVLVVLGILFRNRLRVMFFKFKGGVKSSGVTTTRPPFSPPGMGLRRMFPTRTMPQPIRQQARPIRKETSRTDKELEDTLRKLKEMSK